jgi:hypothetical protein
MQVRKGECRFQSHTKSDSKKHKIKTANTQVRRKRKGSADPDPKLIPKHKIKKPREHASEKRERAQIPTPHKLIPKHKIKTPREICK